MYQISIPVFDEGLKNLSHLLNRGEEDAGVRNFYEEVFLKAKLAPDMFPLARQVQIATDHAKAAPSRLAGRSVPSLPDKETDFAGLRARIDTVRGYLQTFAPDDLEGSAERRIDLKVGDRELHFTGLQYLQGFAIPNFYFHLTTAYNILRHNSVAIGKADFFGRR
jgi:hypothetical protein